MNKRFEQRRIAIAKKLTSVRNAIEVMSLFFRHNVIHWFESRWAKYQVKKIFPKSHESRSMAEDEWWSVWFGDRSDKSISAQTASQAWIDCWQYIKSGTKHGS